MYMYLTLEKDWIYTYNIHMRVHVYKMYAHMCGSITKPGPAIGPRPKQ